nr:S8 family serine peptidase [Pseudomonadota bacterium]
SQTSTNFNDSEYQRSNGANTHGAISAYNTGATGRGVTVAVVDSGINPNLAEFSGRIHVASRDVARDRGVVDNEGHGTAVSGTIAAARNGSGPMGVAFESTILSLNTSNPDNCTPEKGCKHSDSAIAQAVDIARQNGAKVINISLGGDGVGSAVLNAVQQATTAGIVVVISAGNDGRKPEGANPSSFALTTAERAGNGLVIIAGSVGAPIGGDVANGVDTKQISDFSNRAGTGAQFYLSALGYRVRAFDETGTGFLYSGTSFAAPVISGAAALLASAFPNLTGAQIVRLLLTTADEAGEAGRDSTYGNGILNITRAFQPQGQTTLAGSATPISTMSNGQASGPIGDAGKTGSMAGAIILDGYSRAYALDLAKTIARAPQDRPLGQALHGNFRTAGAASGATAVSITVNRNLSGQPHVGLAQAGLSHEDARQAKVVAGIAVSRLTPETAVAFGFSESGRSLQQRLSGHDQNAFLVARDPMARSGFQADASSSIGVRQTIGSIGLTVTNERGRVWNQGFDRALEQPGYSIGAISADRKLGPATLSLGASRLQEDSTVLGGRFSSALSSAGATSYFVDSTASFDLGKGWGAFASYRRGWTGLAGTGGLVEGGRLSTDAWAFDVSKRNALMPGDKFALRVMQPLRVREGGFNMSVPVSYDYATLNVGYEDRFFNLAPSGREIDFEAAYSRPFLGGDLGLNAFYRKDPGHIQAMTDDQGAAIRYTLGF